LSVVWGCSLNGRSFPLRTFQYQPRSCSCLFTFAESSLYLPHSGRFYSSHIPSPSCSSFNSSDTLSFLPPRPFIPPLPNPAQQAVAFMIAARNSTSNTYINAILPRNVTLANDQRHRTCAVSGRQLVQIVGLVWISHRGDDLVTPREQLTDELQPNAT
jgi:hypothetical protein